jgi:hypothetical protein
MIRVGKIGRVGQGLGRRIEIGCMVRWVRGVKDDMVEIALNAYDG